MNTARMIRKMKKSVRKNIRRFRRNLKYRWFRSYIAQWCTAGIIMLIGSILICSLLFPKQVNAGESGEVYYKYYQTITVERGDTLWKYAGIYKSSEMSLADYVKEAEFINQIDNGQLVAGKTVTLPYYSTEYICSEN